MLMGTRFLLGSGLATSSFLGAGVISFCGLASDLIAWVATSGATAFTSGRLAGVVVLACSLLLVFASVPVRLALVPGVDFDLAIVGYSLHMPRFMNELSCSAIHIHITRN